MIDLQQLSDLEILTLTIIGEARGEPIEGQVAVGCVIRNRSHSWNRSVSQICLQPQQFSCWNLNDPNRHLLEELAQGFILGNQLDIRYRQCLCVARGILKDEISDNTHGALNYLTFDLWNNTHKPSWAKNVTFAVSKGNQVFFTARTKLDDTSIA